jgi:ribonuclease E
MNDESKKSGGKKTAGKPVRKVSTGAWWKSAGEKIGKQESKTTARPEKKEKDKKSTQAGKEKKKRSNGKKSTAKAAGKSAGSRAGRTAKDIAETGEVEKAESGSAVTKDVAESRQQKERSRLSNKQEGGTGGRRVQDAAGQKAKPVVQDQDQPDSGQKDDEPAETKKQKRSGKSSGRRGRGKTAGKENRNEPSDRQQGGKKVVTKLLINAEEPEECRIALVENGRLQSFHVNTVVRERTKNNIYKGRIVSVEANLQAAFVDIGTGRNGFLPFSDIHPEYYKEDVSDKARKLISQHQWRKLKIEEVVQRGQEVLVQVVKEVTGNKGANMTTFLSLPGRCLVLMPGSDSAGISRKISGEERRSQLREVMSKFNIPEGIGYIVRTASAEITKTALQQDLRYLLGLWKEIKKRGQTVEAPALIYAEQDTVVRFLRDHFVPDIQEIVVDTQESFDQVTKFVELLPARQRKVQVRLHRGAKPIFNQNNIEEQIESIYQPQVPLPSGGSIVIDPTEALVAIDVNSGRTSKKGDFEESIFLANMEAAEELARQLRLRDLGGLIVVDFIDMRNKKHIREVEKQVKAAMKRDKAKVDISRISRFGLMQISRQKMGAPIEKGSYRRCEYCEGRGVVRSVETLALYYLRRIQTGVSRTKVKRVEARLPLDVGQYLLNRKRLELTELENRHRATIDIIPRPEMKPNENKIDFLGAA